MNEAFGIKLKQAREAQKKSQKDLADFCGVTTASASNWELGVNKPDFENLTKICEFLNVSPNYLFDWNKDSPNTRELTEDSIQLLDSFCQLDERGTDTVLALINNELKQIKNNEKQGLKYFNSLNRSPREIKQIFLQSDHPDYIEMKSKLRRLKQLKKQSYKSCSDISRFLFELGYGAEARLGSIILIFKTWEKVPSRELYDDIVMCLEGNYRIVRENMNG